MIYAIFCALRLTVRPNRIEFSRAQAYAQARTKEIWHSEALFEFEVLMNYLAHIYLASHSDDAMLGALLGDFVKPHSGIVLTAEMEAEIVTHRKIDAFTDSHPVVLHAKQLFVGPSRRYAGILLDVFYDHLLARQWATYSATPLDLFIQRFYAALTRRSGVLPENLALMVPRMIDQDWLGSYENYRGVEVAIRRISTRLSKNGDLMRNGLDDLKRHEAEIARGFDVFFPELIAFVETRRRHERVTSV